MAVVSYLLLYSHVPSQKAVVNTIAFLRKLGLFHSEQHSSFLMFVLAGLGILPSSKGLKYHFSELRHQSQLMNILFHPRLIFVSNIGVSFVLDMISFIKHMFLPVSKIDVIVMEIQSQNRGTSRPLIYTCIRYKDRKLQTRSNNHS